MHPSIAHAIASGIQDPDWRLTDPTPGYERHATSRLRARTVAGPGLAARLRGLLSGRRPEEGPWLSGVVPPLTHYPAQR
jgi:hypothetical protein